MKYIIIAGTSGVAAAERIRRNDEKVEILLLSEYEYVSSADCALPYYISGVIEDRNKLLINDLDYFRDQYKIEVRTKSKLTKIDAHKKEITFADQKGELHKELYDKLLISTETKPIIPSFEGVDLEGVFTLQNILDADAIKNYIKEKNVRNAVIVGAGFVGMQMAESFHKLGIQVSIVEDNKRSHHALDLPMKAIVDEHLLEKGVNLYLDNEIDTISEEDNKLKIRLKNNEKLQTDMILLSLGVESDVELAKQIGLKLGQTGGIWVDDYMQTSLPDVYAVGNAVEYPHPITEEPWLNFMTNPATRQAVVAADNMIFGNTTKYEGSIGTTIAKIFDVEAAATGLSEEKAKALNLSSESIYIHNYSHDGCYPEAKSISLKIIFDPKNGKLLGGQAVGIGVDKRVDQIALAIKMAGSVDDLVKLEQGYAPPFSSVKDVLAVAACVAKNAVVGKMPVVQWSDMDKLNRKEVTIIDARTKDEFAMEALSGAVNIPLVQLRSRKDEIAKNKPIYIYCSTGKRGYLAQQILLKNGFKEVYNLTGGMKTYNYATRPLVEKGEQQDIQKQIVSTVIPTQSPLQIIKKVDASGLQCPGPIVKLKTAVDELKVGETVEITATDPAFKRDVESWTDTTGNILLSNTAEDGKYIAVVQKKGANATPKVETTLTPSHKGKTIIMFSDDLDRAIATFVLANGAAATGEKVTLFFTFWGLNVIKKVKKPKVKKDFFGRMFSIMLPSSSLKLKLSKFNMFGIGSKMMRHIMKKKGIGSVEELRQQALDQGVEFIACEMSMNAMGIKPEELMDEVTIGGVATYIRWADKSNINLFI